MSSQKGHLKPKRKGSCTIVPRTKRFSYHYAENQTVHVLLLRTTHFVKCCIGIWHWVWELRGQWARFPPSHPGLPGAAGSCGQAIAGQLLGRVLKQRGGAGGGRGEVRPAPRGQGEDPGHRQPVRHPVLLTPYMHAICIIVLWLHAFICKVVSANFGKIFLVLLRSSPLSTFHCPLSTVHYLLYTVNCFVHIPNLGGSPVTAPTCSSGFFFREGLPALLSTVHCPLSTVNCPLSTVHCSLFIYPIWEVFLLLLRPAPLDFFVVEPVFSGRT